MKKILLLAVLAVFAGLPAAAGLLTGQGVSLVDSTGGQRTTFSNNEKIGMAMQVNNGIASLNRIVFQFDIVAPSGDTTFRHAGNAVPGTVGNSASQVNGVPVSGFFRGPGVYTLKAMATLDGVTLTQTVTFTVSSPNILLIYPPNGATELSDNPLNFQWFSSGATSYRVTVADNASLYNAPFIQTSVSPSLTYPQNPTDPRQRLAAGQLYYWGVEGLDASGNVIARSEVPSSFSMRAAALTRDLAVTALTATGAPGADGSIPFRITVADQGGTAETGVQLSFTLGGLAAPGAPLIMPAFSAGDSKDFDFAAIMPADQNSSLAIACLQLFDDNVPNNCKTLTVTRPSTGGGSGTGFAAGDLTAEQIWAAIRELLRERGIDLDDYAVTGMEGSLTREELLSLLEQLRNGSATAVVSGPPVSAAPPVATAGPYIPPTTKSDKEAPPPDIPQEGAADTREWAGMTDVAGKANRSFTITSAAVWKKLWSRLNDRKLPDVDFKKEMIVGIIGGKDEVADNIAIESVQETLNGLFVRYRLVVHRRHLEVDGVKRAQKRSTVPYILRIAPRNSLQVKFVEVKENQDE